MVTVAVVLGSPVLSRGQQSASSLELSRPARPWEFLCATGSGAGLFGKESGEMEAWVYPLKILRNFHLQFAVAGRVLEAEALARTVVVRPESSTVVYASDTFAVEETFFVPVNQPGAVITIKVTTSEPLDVRAGFVRDFQLEWPAALGGTFADWDPALRTFSFGEERRQFAALVGSPTADKVMRAYETNYSSSIEDSFSLGVTDKGQATKVVVIAASTSGLADAQAVYRRLEESYESLQREAANYYRSYLEKTVTLSLPDPQLQQAYDWSRISVLQGLVTNPSLGTGLVAGYRTSGSGQRPGFAWFFGRDSLWTSFALNSEGDFASARAALDFLSKYQRDDGKIAHEISQSANLVDWFKAYPYAYASADATPLYIVAVADYAEKSGDLAFVQQKWESLWRAYQFLLSTYNASGLPTNAGIGHGWVEGGPLLPVSSELYQVAVGAEALRALAELAHVVGKEDISRQLAEDFAKQRTLLERRFWLPEKQRFAFALDTSGQPIDEPTVLATVPMWFGLLADSKANSMINLLSGPDHEADWGMRIISSAAARYDPGGYHYGSVWPLFTGWAAVGEYRYHHPLSAYQNLRANALLALDGALGHVTEVLSGDYYQPLASSSPHQIWSAAMVVSPLLRGLLGLSVDAATHSLILAPHVPAEWNSFAVSKLPVGRSTVSLRYKRTDDEIILETDRDDTSQECNIEFSPAISLRGDVIGVELNGNRVPYEVQKNDTDQHVKVRFAVTDKAARLRISIRNDFAIGLTSALPALGSTSSGLRIIAESWTTPRDRLDLDVVGRVGAIYELSVRGSAQLSRVENANLLKSAENTGKVRIKIPERPTTGYEQVKVRFYFTTKPAEKKLPRS